MNNLQQDKRGGFRFEHVVSVSEDGKKKKVSRFEVFYRDGGISGKVVRVSIRDLEKEKGDGYVTETFVLYQGKYVAGTALALPRKNMKKVLAVAEALDSSVPLIMAAYAESVELGKAALAQAIAEKVQVS